MATKADLVDRWRDPAGRATARQVLERLRAGRLLDDLSLGTTKLGTDLRGFVVPDQLALGLELSNVDLQGLDLTHAQLPGLALTNCRISNCCFASANCGDWRIRETHVTRCDFGKALLTGATVGSGVSGGRANRWRDVNFSGADFRDAVLVQAVFEGCVFAKAKLTKAEFRQCQIAGSTFTGRLKQVIFDCRDLPDFPAPPAMRSVDFSQAEFDDVEFKSCVMEGTTFPDSPDVLVTPRLGCVAECGIQRLENDTSDAADDLRWSLREAVRGPGFNPHSTGVFTRREFVLLGGEDLADLAFRILPQCGESCSGKGG